MFSYTNFKLNISFTSFIVLGALTVTTVMGMPAVGGDGGLDARAGKTGDGKSVSLYLPNARYSTNHLSYSDILCPWTRCMWKDEH